MTLLGLEPSIIAKYHPQQVFYFSTNLTRSTDDITAGEGEIQPLAAIADF